MALVGVTSTSATHRIQISHGAGAAADEVTVAGGVDVIHQALEPGNPIKIGLNIEGQTKQPDNVDGVTDHFVTIVDRGVDTDGREFFRFYDNGSGQGNYGEANRSGADESNRLYLQEDGTIRGSSTWSGSTIMTITMVRPNSDQVEGQN